MNKLLLIILSVLAAALLHGPRALADSPEPIDTVETTAKPLADTRTAPREQARQANAEAVAEAAKNIVASTRLHLDILLPGRTSEVIAGP